MSSTTALNKVKTIADPNAVYESLLPLWQRSRAVCSGERFVKDLDTRVSPNNMLIPFSPTMSQRQYDFYKSEAELPGITAQFARMVVGGLLRKQPVIELPEEFGDEVLDWLMNEFSQDDMPITAFLDEALWEEIQTNRTWVQVDYPAINEEDFDELDQKEYKPYPIILKAENVINYHTKQSASGRVQLIRVIVKGSQEVFEQNEFHPTVKECIWVHELDEQGLYQIRRFEKPDASPVRFINGVEQVSQTKGEQAFVEVDVNQNILLSGKRLDFIPIWPLNGKLKPNEPLLDAIINKEIALYNKVSRRNHLLYGAATYTPIICSDMSDEDFDEIVSSGLGTWIKLRQGDTATTLDTPTGALADMDRAITAGIEEIARLGVRMLSPETSQSGVALELRNAAQTAQLGTLNIKVSNVMQQIISFMVNWRYGTELAASDVKFTLSKDFMPSPAGQDWLRLATEWYQQGLIPRSVWLTLLKHNDMLPPEYDDEAGRQEITEDLEQQQKSTGNPDFENQIAKE